MELVLQRRDIMTDETSSDCLLLYEPIRIEE